MAHKAGWTEIDSQVNAVATATRAAESTKSHLVYSVSASFSATAIALLQIKDDTTLKWEGYVYDKEHVEFPRGLKIVEGNACSAVLSAGGATITGKVNLNGVSI